jgi:DNA-binding response OmpR family regulator
MNKKILIIDDEPHILRALSYILKKRGYNIFTAANGEEGFKVAKEIIPDLIFLDVIMPKLNGYEVLKRLKKDPLLKSTYIIMLTVKNEEIDEELAKKYGVDEYILKPFSPLKIISKIKKIFGE